MPSMILSQINNAKIYGIVYYGSNKSVEFIDALYLKVIDKELSIENFIKETLPKQKKHIKIDNVFFDALDIESKEILIANYHNKTNYKRIFSKTYKNDFQMKPNLYILGITKLYTYISNFYPYEYDLDDFFVESVTKMTNEPTIENYEEILKEFGIRLNDLHTSIKKTEGKLILPSKEKALPFNFEILNNGRLLITRILSEDIKLLLNDTIILINNAIPEKFTIDLYKGGGVDSTTKWLNLDTSITLFDVKRKNEIIKIKNSENNYISTMNWINKNFYYQSNTIGNTSKNITYVNFNNTSKEKVKFIMNNNNNIDTLIVDYRGYPSNNDKVRSQLNGFLKNNEFSLMIQKPSLELNKKTNPFKFSYADNINEKFKGFIYILVNHFTQSASEISVIDLIHNDNYEIIGQYSANAFGSVYDKIYLPGGYSFRTTYEKIYTNKNELYRINGIIPSRFYNDYEMDNFIFLKH